MKETIFYMFAVVGLGFIVFNLLMFITNFYNNYEFLKELKDKRVPYLESEVRARGWKHVELCEEVADLKRSRGVTGEKK